MQAQMFEVEITDREYADGMIILAGKHIAEFDGTTDWALEIDVTTGDITFTIKDVRVDADMIEREVTEYLELGTVADQVTAAITSIMSAL